MFVFYNRKTEERPVMKTFCCPCCRTEKPIEDKIRTAKHHCRCRACVEKMNNGRRNILDKKKVS